MEAVVLMSKNGGSKAPTVLVPHGGPHSAYPAAYILSFAYLNALGYNVLQVNYRCCIVLQVLTPLGNFILSDKVSGHYVVRVL